MTAALKRFYREVTVAPCSEGFQILLDGRMLNTHAKRPLYIPVRELAEAVAEEWQECEELIQPDAMPMTRLMNLAHDRAEAERAQWVEELCEYANTDLLCYRAEEVALREKQAQLWNPVLERLGECHALKFVCVEGVLPIPQPEASLTALRDLLDRANAFEVTALAMMTPILGSVLLAVALWQGHIQVEEALDAARVDEDHQQACWGEDAELTRAWGEKQRDIAACALLLMLCKTI
jgi:chaperone required for assembly of F1-ATPase